jgi:hypothetical protein
MQKNLSWPILCATVAFLSCRQGGSKTATPPSPPIGSQGIDTSAPSGLRSDSTTRPAAGEQGGKSGNVNRGGTPGTTDTAGRPAGGAGTSDTAAVPQRGAGTVDTATPSHSTRMRVRLAPRQSIRRPP